MPAGRIEEPGGDSIVLLRLCPNRRAQGCQQACDQGNVISPQRLSISGFQQRTLLLFHFRNRLTNGIHLFFAFECRGECSGISRSPAPQFDAFLE